MKAKFMHLQNNVLRILLLCTRFVCIVRLLVATLHVGMAGKQDGGYTQLT